MQTKVIETRQEERENVESLIEAGENQVLDVREDRTHVHYVIQG